MPPGWGICLCVCFSRGLTNFRIERDWVTFEILRTRMCLAVWSRELWPVHCHSLSSWASSWASLRTGVAGCQMGPPTLASRVSRPHHFPSHIPLARCYLLDDGWAPVLGPVVIFWWSLSDMSPTPTTFTRSSSPTRRPMGVRHALLGATNKTNRLAWDEFEPDVNFPTAIPELEPSPFWVEKEVCRWIVNLPASGWFSSGFARFPPIKH